MQQRDEKAFFSLSLSCLCSLKTPPSNAALGARPCCPHLKPPLTAHCKLIGWTDRSTSQLSLRENRCQTQRAKDKNEHPSDYQSKSEPDISDCHTVCVNVQFWNFSKMWATIRGINLWLSHQENTRLYSAS